MEAKTNALWSGSLSGWEGGRPKLQIKREGKEGRGNREKEDMTQKKPIFTKAQTENKIKRRIQFGLQLILKIKEKYKTEINVQLTT